MTNEPKTDETRHIICGICAENFINEPALRCHLIKKHKMSSQGAYDTLHPNEEHTCPTCGRPNPWHDRNRAYANFCSVKCRATNTVRCERIAKTRSERYAHGTETGKKWQEKVKKTNLGRFGHEHFFAAPIVRAKVLQTVRDKYGVDNVSQVPEFKAKVVATNLAKFGFAHTLQNKENMTKLQDALQRDYGANNPQQAPVLRARIAATNMARYGRPYSLQNAVVRAKMRQTLLDNYGVDHPFKSTVVRERCWQTSIARYGLPMRCMIERWESCVEFVRQNQEYAIAGTKDDYAQTHALKLRHTCGSDTDFLGNRHACGVCFPAERSKTQANLCGYLDSLGVVFSQNNRSVLGGKELDIVIPSLGLAIELDGVYWHCLKNLGINRDLSLGERKAYHLTKTIEAEKAGYRLIHIWDTEWENKKDIVKSRLASLVGKSANNYYARKLALDTAVPRDEGNAFFQENHLQGALTVRQAYLGLRGADGRLLSCMSFGQGRYGCGHDNQHELLRFASRLNCSVVGAASRLLKAYQLPAGETMVSFADRRWSKPGDDMYTKLGFACAKAYPPGMWYTDYHDVVHRLVFMQRAGLKRKANLADNRWHIATFKDELSVTDNLALNGWYPIYDCGTLRYELTVGGGRSPQP